MANKNRNIMNTSYIISLYADYNESAKTYNDHNNWGNCACNKCKFSVRCPYYKHDPFNRSSCFRFVWSGYDRIDIVLKRKPNDHTSEIRYSCFMEGILYDKIK